MMYYFNNKRILGFLIGGLAPLCLWHNTFAAQQNVQQQAQRLQAQLAALVDVEPWTDAWVGDIKLRLRSAETVLKETVRQIDQYFGLATTVWGDRQVLKKELQAHLNVVNRLLGTSETAGVIDTTKNRQGDFQLTTQQRQGRQEKAFETLVRVAFSGNNANPSHQDWELFDVFINTLMRDPEKAAFDYPQILLQQNGQPDALANKKQLGIAIDRYVTALLTKQWPMARRDLSREIMSWRGMSAGLAAWKVVDGLQWMRPKLQAFFNITQPNNLLVGEVSSAAFSTGLGVTPGMKKVLFLTAGLCAVAGVTYFAYTRMNQNRQGN